MVLENSVSMIKNKPKTVHLSLTAYTKVNSKWIIGLYIKNKIIKLSKENRENLQYLELCEKLLVITPDISIF